MASTSVSNRLTECVATSNSDSGFVITDGGVITKNIIDRCLATDNTNLGFFINGADNTVKNCQASNNGRGFAQGLPGSVSVFVSNLAHNNSINYLITSPTAQIGVAASYWINVFP